MCTEEGTSTKKGVEEVSEKKYVIRNTYCGGYEDLLFGRPEDTIQIKAMETSNGFGTNARLECERIESVTLIYLLGPCRHPNSHQGLASLY